MICAVNGVSGIQVSEQLLTILYRDDRYIAVDKPSGLLVHKTPLDKLETRFCMQILRDQIGSRVYPCHRLDKPTSGVLLFALDKDALAAMSRVFMLHEARKQYLAIVRGWIEESGLIDHPLAYVPDAGESRGTGVPQEAITQYRLLRKYELPVPSGDFATTRYSLAQLLPLTGRQHQLRRHMKHISHPVIGDTRFGDGWHNRMFRERFDCHRLLLHASNLQFLHPFTGDNISIRSDPGKDFDIHLPTAD